MTTGWTVALRKPPSERIPGKAALRLVAGFEGLSLKAYPDPASPRAKTGQGSGDPWTIGYGHTGPDVYEGLTCTLAQADAWLAEDLDEAAGIVRAQITVRLAQGEFDALCSIVFNLGYIPKSMKAALNGGVSDKGEVFSPGSYGSALKQFPRNCRAAGIPMRGLLRRRLAEACVFSDLPWEAACSLNIIRLELDARGNPDPIATTSLEDTLERARQDVPILRPDVSDVLKRPWPAPADPVAAGRAIDAPMPDLAREATIDGVPIPEIEDDELFLNTPAASVSADANGTPPIQPTQPAGSARVPSISEPEPAKPSNSSQSPVSAPQVESATAARPVPPAVAPAPLPPPPKPVVIAPKSIDIKAIPYGEVLPENGAKNMTDSTRFIGMLIVAGGSLVQVLAAREVVSSTAGAIFFDLSRDPVIVALIAGGVIWVVGSLTRWWGKKVITKGMVNAKEVLK